MDLEHFDEGTNAIEFDPMDIDEFKVYERSPERIPSSLGKEIEGECIQCCRYYKDLKQHFYIAHANQPVPIYAPNPNDLARSNNLKKRKARDEPSNENTQRLIKKRQIAPNIPANTMDLAFGQKTFKQYSLPSETVIEPIVNITELRQPCKIDNISPIIDLD